jgi:SpoIID/LytB domain protein
VLAVLLFLSSLAAARPTEDYETPPALEEPSEPEEKSQVDVSPQLKSGHALYFKGDHAGALKAYQAAVKLSSRSLEGWLNGAAVLDELGETKRALEWYARAAGISKDVATVVALGSAQLRFGDAKTAEATFKRALQTSPSDSYALLGLARARLAFKDPAEAAALLKRSAEASPLLNLTHFFLGRAYEALGDPARTVEAYRQAVGADSYFHEGRDALARAYLRQRSAAEALRQFTRILTADPNNKRVQAMVQKVQPLLGIKPGSPPAAAAAAPSISIPELQPGGPLIRAVIWSDGLGKPKARSFVSLSASSDFVFEDLKGKKLAEGKADEFWDVELKAKGKKRLMQLSSPGGRFRLLRGEPFVIRPVDPNAVVALSESGPRATALSTPKLLRGIVEAALTPSRRSLRLVNTIDLERYTHGVVSAEMPIRSPIEALKAQAVVARSHALFIKKVTRRHRKDGYDVCDDQHCQVYAGLRAESDRSRSVVDGTRKRVAMFNGRVAHVIYSSNCGGHTQNSTDLTGWGNLEYWKGVPDTPEAQAKPPRSPWLLRRYLTSMPQAYCKPSSYVHPSHYRWTRVISWRELEERAARRFKGLGKLKHVRPLRRAASGNVNTFLVQGSKKTVKVTSEMSIRGLLGVGSVRSTLFFFEVEYNEKGAPEQLVFHGGGWGHAVGLCQSGAMGRAEAGQGYDEIVKSYFTGVSLGEAEY